MTDAQRPGGTCETCGQYCRDINWHSCPGRDLIREFQQPAQQSRSVARRLERTEGAEDAL